MEASPYDARMFARLRQVGHHLARLRDRLVQRIPWLGRIGWPEIIVLGCALVAFLIANWLIELTDDVQEGDTTRFDQWVVRSFRRADDPAVPIGPAWLREVGLDITALGSIAIIVLVVFAVVAFLALRRQWRVMWLVLAASIGATILSTAFKHFVGRDRPDVVPHLREVTTASFPSGHATVSAAVYLTLAAILAQVVRGRWTRTYCLLLPVFVVAAIGLSRVYLGVHYPTDVLAGWSLGLAWALVCWAAAHYLKERGLLHLWRRPAE